MLEPLTQRPLNSLRDYLLCEHAFYWTTGSVLHSESGKLQLHDMFSKLQSKCNIKCRKFNFDKSIFKSCKKQFIILLMKNVGSCQ